MNLSAQVLDSIERFFVTWRFAVFAVTLLTSLTALLAALLWIPAEVAGLGAFAEEFRVWCFGSASTAAGAGNAMVLGTFAELLLFAALIAGVYSGQLRDGWKDERRRLGPFAAAGLALTFAATGGLWWVSTSTPAGPPAFPARELRTQIPAPAVELTNQRGEAVSLTALRGRVVLVTAVYASCGLACPRILGQAKRAVAKLTAEEQHGLVVLGITLDPERDSTAVLDAMATAQHVEPPLYQLLTGPADRVNRALDAFSVERKRNPETGVIDHANLFTLIDRQGRVAYRFTLSDLQERWMVEALHLLLRESAMPSTALRD